MSELLEQIEELKERFIEAQVDACAQKTGEEVVLDYIRNNIQKNNSEVDQNNEIES